MVRMDRRALLPISDLLSRQKNYPNAPAKLILCMNNIFDRFSSFSRICLLSTEKFMRKSSYCFSKDNPLTPNAQRRKFCLLLITMRCSLCTMATPFPPSPLRSWTSRKSDRVARIEQWIRESTDVEWRRFVVEWKIDVGTYRHTNYKFQSIEAFILFLQ